MNAFMLGALSMGFGVLALYFLRFWRQSRDRFFAWFSMSFALMSGNQIALAIFGEHAEYETILYSVRLFAFVLILVAILDKNRNRKAGSA